MGELHEHYIDIIRSQPFHNECCIYRVYEKLRRLKPEAYEPQVVSIGPYHRKNPKLQAMENHKRWFLRSLLERRNERKEKYTQELGGLVEKVRNCYAEPIDLNDDEFVEMMLLDGCFIIEFFLKETPNPTLSVGWMENQIYWDLMLLENQLPFFLLSHLYDMFKENPKEEPLILKAKSFISDWIPDLYLNSQYFDDYDPQGIKHLLHLLHVLCYPKTPHRIAQGLNTIYDKIKVLVLFPWRILSNALLMLLILITLLISTRDETQNENDTLNQMHGAVELKEAGVKFKKVAEFYSKSANFFDIKFEDGLMELPCFAVEDSTDTFFRNLIAFDQHSDVELKYFTDFADFMDQLMDSGKDVELLRLEGIIVNFLGDDHEVSNLFNKLSPVVMLSFPESYYSDVCTKVNRHCRKPWNRVSAKLRHDYFNNPWATISTLGAIALLGLAIAQTVGTYK